MDKFKKDNHTYLNLNEIALKVPFYQQLQEVFQLFLTETSELFKTFKGYGCQFSIYLLFATNPMKRLKPSMNCISESRTRF